MPTYSYRCTECGEAFDIVQSFTDDTLTVCPTCGGVLRKVFSPVGVSFSGSGFYRTDSRAESTATSKKKKEAASAGESSSKPAETSSAPAASTPSKPATAASSEKTPTKKSDKKKES